MNPKNRATSPGQHAQPKPAQKFPILQPKVSAQRATSPPVYRPQHSNKSVQLQTGQTHRQPIAPPAFRPQPVPKCLQMKTATNHQPQRAQAVPRPSAPPVYRPQAIPKVLQARGTSQGPSATKPGNIARPPAVQLKTGVVNQHKHGHSNQLDPSRRPCGCTSPRNSPAQGGHTPHTIGVKGLANKATGLAQRKISSAGQCGCSSVPQPPMHKETRQPATCKPVFKKSAPQATVQRQTPRGLFNRGVVQLMRGKYPNTCDQVNSRMANDPGWGWVGMTEGPEKVKARGDKAHYEVQKYAISHGWKVEYGIPEGASSGNRGYADIVDEDRGLIYEIKHANTSQDWETQLNRYVTQANNYCYKDEPKDVTWRIGTGFQDVDIPWNSADKNNDIMVISQLVPGLIRYIFRKKGQSSITDSFSKASAKPITSNVNSSVLATETNSNNSNSSSSNANSNNLALTPSSTTITVGQDPYADGMFTATLDDLKKMEQTQSIKNIREALEELISNASPQLLEEAGEPYYYYGRMKW
ncbi:MAG TPA: hypothetical protein VGN95_09680 [Pyrinomonadaceae bacterium]|nr:hypothetical protein [Pyrinomonadaceae bacterium]